MPRGRTLEARRICRKRLSGAVEIVTPRDPEARGCQLSVRLALPSQQAKRCFERLTAAGVVGDWREPDTLRIAPIPLYNSFRDVLDAVDALARAAAS